MKKNKTCLFSSENGQNVTITPEKQIEIEEDFDSTRKCGSASDSSAVSLLFIYIVNFTLQTVDQKWKNNAINANAFFEIFVFTPQRSSSIASYRASHLFEKNSKNIDY